MPKLSISLDIVSSPVALLYGSTAAYVAGGYFPQFVADFRADYYRTEVGVKTFANTITHTRASTATYVDSTGTLQTAAINEPRVGHHVWNGSAWVNEGLLHESEARTNLLTYSEDLSNAAWTKSAVTIGTPVTRKGISLDLLTATTTFSSVSQSIGSVANAGYATFSVFVEAGTSTRTAIRIGDVLTSSATNRVTRELRWTSGVPSLVASSTGGLTFVSESVEDWGDGLYRVSLTIQNNTGGALTLFAHYHVTWDLAEGTVNTYAGGFQAEIGPTPSSYIPTNGQQVTRAAETLTVPAANLPWPEPVVIGEELVTNGTFDTDTTGWAAVSDATLALNANRLEVTSNSGFTNGLGSTSITTVIGKVYQISLDITLGTSASYKVWVGTAASTSSSGASMHDSGVQTATQSYSAVFTATATTTYINLVSTDSGGTTLFDNISVREINPLSVSIQMQGRQTYSDGNDTANNTFVAWPDTVSGNYIWLFGDSDRGTGGVTFRARANSVISSRESNGSVYSPGVFVPYNISVRVGSTFLNGATDGTALTAITTPVSIPDTDGTDLNLAYDYMGTIKLFRMWSDDLADAGIVEATLPSLEPSLSLTFDGSETSFTVLDWSA